MKTRNLFLIALACAGMSACTNDDVEVSGGTQQVFEGDKAYMCVRISDVGSQTRATARSLEYGTAAEHAVADAHFYFYDDAGVFVAEGTVTNAAWSEGNGNADSPTGDGDTNNIEWESNTVVVLSGLTHKAYPNYMVTVLNEPAGFTPPATLEEMEKALASNDKLSIMQDETSKTNFTMSTTSYGNGLDYYFVNEVTQENFSTEPIDLDASDVNPITVYVERLAAKVTLDVDSELAATATTLTDGTTGYALTKNITTVTGTDETPVYVRIEGWTLNAIAKRSNIVKNIDTSWDASVLGFKWDDPDNFRSYWGMSWNYGEGVYPASSGNNTPTEEANDDTALNNYLTYVNLQTPSSLGDSEYCGENTNTAGSGGIIQSANSSAITSILVKATVCDADGNGLDLVKYDGLLYTKDHYIAYALEHLSDDSSTAYLTDDGLEALANLNVYVNVAGENETPDYKQIDAGYVDFADGVDGIVRIALKDGYKGTQFYSLSTNDNNEVIPAEIGEISQEDPTASYDAVNTYFDDAFNTPYAADANGYNGGLMYYNIPIEHLNDTKATDSSGNIVPAEGNYGVVRNHHYYVTITSIENLGTGIFDPDEVIVPYDTNTYYLSSLINILSWKVVSQQVGL